MLYFLYLEILMVPLQLKNLRRETADLLAKNQLDMARVRVEAVTREVKMLQVRRSGGAYYAYGRQPST